MNNEFETTATVKDAAGVEVTIPVTAGYELDGYKPIGVWAWDADGNDCSDDLTDAGYDLLYIEACNDAAESLRSRELPEMER